MKLIASLSVKPVAWIGSTRAELASFPEDVKDAIGYALSTQRNLAKHPDAKPLRALAERGIPEVVEDHAGDTCRAGFTVRSAGHVSV